MVKVIMKDDTIVELEWYSDIPKYRWHNLLFFEELWSYQWEWYMVSEKDNIIYLWRDSYWSCTVCDNFQSFESENYEWEWENTKTQEEADNFVYAYNPEKEFNRSEITKDIIKEWLNWLDDYHLEYINKDEFADRIYNSIK